MAKLVLDPALEAHISQRAEHMTVELCLMIAKFYRSEHCYRDGCAFRHAEQAFRRRVQRYLMEQMLPAAYCEQFFNGQ